MHVNKLFALNWLHGLPTWKFAIFEFRKEHTSPELKIAKVIVVSYKFTADFQNYDECCWVRSSFEHIFTLKFLLEKIKRYSNWISQYTSQRMYFRSFSVTWQK